MTERRRPQFAHFSRTFTNKNREQSGNNSSKEEKERDVHYKPWQPISGLSMDEPEFLIRQNHDLKKRLEEESNNYKRRLESYKQAQQHQAALVSRLQAKILQYKQRCADLENQAESNIGGGESPRSKITSILPLPSVTSLNALELNPNEAVRLLEEERTKCEKLRQVNNRLKEQLQEAYLSNESLTNDLQKITNEWETLREELIMKEEEWRDEEHAFNEFYTAEHSRLLMLWRDAVGVKKMFTEMQINTERDLNRLKNEIVIFAKDFLNICGNLKNTSTLSLHRKEHHVMQQEQEINDLKTKLKALQTEHETSLLECKQKDERLQQILRDLKTLEERCLEVDQNSAQFVRMQEEVELLYGALRDIAHAVLQDAECRDSDGIIPASHVHLTPPIPVPPRSPKRGIQKTPSSPAFAESTISAVQAALHKYQLQIHDCQVKLTTNQEQYTSLKEQYEAVNESQLTLTSRVTDLTSQLDSAKAQVNQLAQERDFLSKSLEGTRAEKQHLQKTEIEISAALDSLNGDFDKLQRSYAKLQKLYDSLEDEKLFLQNEIERLIKDGEVREKNLREEENRSSRMREEILTLRENLNKAYLEKEMLQSHKLEAHAILAQLEKNKSDLETELEKLLLDKADLQETLEKLENLGTNLEDDKIKLKNEIKRLEGDKCQLQNQNTDQQNDLMSLRKELLQAEQTRLDLESEKVSLHEKVKFLEVEKEKVEVELGTITRERNDLRNEVASFCRKKESLSEEIMRLRQRLEQASETNARVNRNLEDLVKDNEEKQIVLESNEKELQRIQEQFASLRSEKEALEGILFDTQTNLESSGVKKLQLEKDNQDLVIKQEALKCQISRLKKDMDVLEKRAKETKTSMMQQMEIHEADFQQVILNLKKNNEENIKKLVEEKDQIKMSLEKKLLSSIQQLNGEKDREIQQLQERIDALQQHIENLCQQHEEVLLRAENEKQQALMLVHQDQQALIEKLDSCKKKINEEKASAEKLKRESMTRSEQDRIAINNLRDELGLFKTKMEEAKIKAEDEKLLLQKKIEEIKSERDAVLAEYEELKIQIHILEDKHDSLINQLHETQRKLKENENSLETLRKELTDVRRQLADCNIEKEKYNSTNKELREHIKRTETEKRGITRNLDEANQKITALEDAKTSLDSEKIRLQTQLKEGEKNFLKLTQQLSKVQEDLNRAQNTSSVLQNEDKEKQARLTTEIEEKEKAQQELHQLKKQIIELDNSLEIARQEMLRLRSRSDDEENRWRHREQELIARLEDSRNRERKLEDQKHNLEVCLADATQQIQELRARLGGSEGRVKALDQQLQQVEATKKEVEQKLSSIGSTLRRIAGIQLDGSISLPFKLLSPSRRWSPASRESTKSTLESHDHLHHGPSHPHCHGETRDLIIDIDPEVIRKGVRALMQQVAQIERERDDLKISLNQMKKQIKEAADVQSKSDEKLNQVLQNLRVTQEERQSLEAKLDQKQAAMHNQSETLHQQNKEIQELREKVTSMESIIHNFSEEKSQYEEKLEKMKTSISRLEGEKRCLLEEVSRAESRATKLELHRMSLEGDLHRIQMIVQDKDSHLQKLQERCENQSRNVTTLEERCVSLKTTIDNLNASMEKASSSESELRKEVAILQKSLVESNANTSSSNEKLKHLQKTLTNVENERRLLVERLEGTQKALTEVRRNYQALQDQTQRLQTDLANNEVQRSSLEAQLRYATSFSGSELGQRIPADIQEEELFKKLEAAKKEKLELREKIDSLNERIRQLEGEKHGLERQVAKGAILRSKSFERPEKGSKSFEGNIFHTQLESENRDLRIKIRKLEAQLAEKEPELTALKNHQSSDVIVDRTGEIEKFRGAQLQAERLLEAREQSHRQQVSRLENQIQLLREQLNQEVKRRQMYVLRSSRAGREMQHLREALGDSLRTVSQDPALDSMLLEQEARKLDTTVTSTAPTLALPAPSFDYPSSLK